MTKFCCWISLATLCIAATLLASPADEKLTIEGPVEIQQREKQIIVKEDVECIKTFPFNIKAPNGGLFYQWTVPAGVQAEKRGNVLKVTAAPNGPLTISAEWAVIAIDWDKKTYSTETKFGSYTVNVGDLQKTVPPPPKVDPPPPPQTPGFYLLIVRADGPASTEFTRIMADPAWGELVKAGHKYKDKQKSEAPAILGVDIPPTLTLPTVFRLRISADGKTSTVVGTPFPLPTTSAAILKLGETP